MTPRSSAEPPFLLAARQRRERQRQVSSGKEGLSVTSLLRTCRAWKSMWGFSFQTGENLEGRAPLFSEPPFMGCTKESTG